MAKKAAPKGTRKKNASSASGDPPFDLRAIESFLSQLGPAAEPDDPLAQAQDIMWGAWDLNDRRRRIALAKKALKISPLCADAFVMLAMEAAADNDEALNLYRQGVEAGEKAIGEDVFRDDVGHFWGILETRPYMRARQGLAEALWGAGGRDEAIEHYQDMLRLNPNDNQGIRYLLLDYLLALGRDVDAAQLIKLYEDDGAAAWVWSAALLSFRRNGETAATHSALLQACKTNNHVPAYLLGDKKMPRQLPDYISWGSVDEAITYVATAAEAWAAAPGALEWLAAAAPSRSSPRTGPPARQPGLKAPLQIDTDRIDDAVLALLRLGMHSHGRVWKSFDWDALDRLYKKGYISDPVGKAKSVVLTETGEAKSEQLFRELFTRK